MISLGVTTLINFDKQIINLIQMYLLLMILHRAQDNKNILLHLGLKLLTIGVYSTENSKISSRRWR